MTIGRVSKATLCPQVSNISLMFINLRWSSQLYCGDNLPDWSTLRFVSEKLLLYLYILRIVCKCFRHCRVTTAHCVYIVMRSAMSHAIRLWLPPAPNPVEPTMASLCVLSWLGNDKSCSSSSGCCGCIRIQNRWPFCTPRLTNSQWRCQLRSPEVNLKCDFN